MLNGLFGGSAINERVEEDFPTWEEFSEKKLSETDEKFKLPPHKIYITSPLHGNFLYFLLMLAALALGYKNPEAAPQLIYGAIGAAFIVGIGVVFRDGLFLHLESRRLVSDGSMINRHSEGPELEGEEENSGGFLRGFYRKGKKSKVFRSKLLQIHYQNILRTFEQGNRRAWVGQDASIVDIHTLISQRGMKLVWTIIEVLPLMGLLGTLIGLTHMFLAFSETIDSPELALLSGFGTALGTTIVANVFVLVLRPLFMRNERAMHELLSSIQVLMAIFILPTQQAALENTAQGLYKGSGGYLSGGFGGSGAQSDSRLSASITELSGSLSEFTEAIGTIESGAMAKETAMIAKETSDVARDVKTMLRGMAASMDGLKLDRQQNSFTALARSMEKLSGSLAQGGGAVGGSNQDNKRIEHDLTQIRVITHDTLILLDKISGQLSATGNDLLTKKEGLRGQLFGGKEGAKSGKSGDAKGSPLVRLFEDGG